ncbi:AMP-binding protein [Winogradskyella sp.]|uniref:AMP-binding protein n=1 Tax=Winogradskyella sp. TaxID=1883156 RepID=UPI003F69802E
MIYIDGIEYIKSDNDYVRNAVINQLHDMSVSVNTSGTTGNPKPVNHTAESIKKISDYNTEFFNLKSNSRMLSLYSPRGIAFTTMSLYPCVDVGCDLFIETKISDYINRMNILKPTHTLVLPSVYNSFSKHVKWNSLDLSDCEQVLMGSDFTPVAALTNLRMLGAKTAYSVYGSTETPPIIAYTESDNHYTWEGINPNAHVKIENQQLFVKWKHQDQWWESGDLVEETNRGFKLVGRKLNMFKLGECGNRVYPEQVEKVAIELGSTRALCKKVNEKCYLYYMGNINETHLRKSFSFDIIPKHVEHIEVDENLRKIKRDQVCA